MMEVRVADSAGACYGVKRALDMARRASASGKSTQTLGPLIHNPVVVNELAAKGVGVVQDPANVNADLVIVRSHGVTPETMFALEKTGAEILDATCPHVLRAQKSAYSLAQSGKAVLVVGESTHPEVEGLCAWARLGGAEPLVAADPADLPSGLPEVLGVVVQTTQTRDRLESIIADLEKRKANFELCDTICSATSKRQEAATRLAGQVEMMVVVGGRNSSNTARLYEICSRVAPRALHVEHAGELHEKDFFGISLVGVTAGASTPDEQITQVVETLKSFA